MIIPRSPFPFSVTNKRLFLLVAFYSGEMTVEKKSDYFQNVGYAAENAPSGLRTPDTVIEFQQATLFASFSSSATPHENYNKWALEYFNDPPVSF